MSRGDDIDELLSSVRNFVAHKDVRPMAETVTSDKLLLTPETRLSDEQVKAIDAEWEAELRALEAAGIIAPGKALEMTIAELEEAVAKLPDDWEPSAESDTGVETQDAPQTSWASDPSDADEASDITTSETSALALSEDDLRALVVKIVHEELSGELGERITRNVRKMVRREINRVMTSRDLGND
ncbi:hypothetical protein [Yoonia litorea]|uniref:Uncharacterized protein n=1 Tax=Yoonia litorea TaxID=1123755 RepID=A0A1I6N283_9RHOB|nr:hypothetical protein [Yoonia litorea]SFS22046.1 hypothetical protein SAMN05444714_3106 [Yoonia litorea]